MTQQYELLKKIEKLPEKYFDEVIDFLGYLQHKAQQEVNDTEREQALEKSIGEWVNPLLGLGKAMGSTLTLDRFMEMQQEEIARENENDQRLWGKK